MALVQDALELRNAVGAGPLERDLIGNADDLHGPGVTRYFTVGDGHHVIEPQGLGCGRERKEPGQIGAGGSAGGGREGAHTHAQEVQDNSKSRQILRMSWRLR